MKISKEGLDLIKSFEGCRLKAYKAHFTEKYYTIGWGHYGPDVAADMVITQEAADKMLISDMKPYEDKVNKYDKKYDWSQNEFDALVSFCYNIGNIDQLTAKGSRDKKTIADKMLLYVNCNGYKLPGLVRRRNAERTLFLKSSSSVTPSKVEIPEPTLRRRCKNENVKKLQHACNVLFNTSLEEDGSFGPLTQEAIRGIQKASGKLAIDGIYGPKTYAYFKEVAG